MCHRPPSTARRAQLAQLFPRYGRTPRHHAAVHGAFTLELQVSHLVDDRRRRLLLLQLAWHGDTSSTFSPQNCSGAVVCVFAPGLSIICTVALPVVIGRSARAMICDEEYRRDSQSKLQAEGNTVSKELESENQVNTAWWQATLTA